jgi:inorganic pyrophosphatase
MKNWIILILALAFYACSPTTTPADPKSYPAQTENGINVVIEIPAGTNKKIEYQSSTGTYQTDQRDGRDRIIDFLPYPGNYGFIPSTIMSESGGGDGDAIDVLLLCEALPTGTVIEARAIGALQLLDEGQLDTKIIAIPMDTTLQTLSPESFTEFSIRYDGARHIIETWFLYYDGLGTNTFEGWLDEKKTLALIAHYTH